MADTPALAPEYGYYQRLLARDQSEAADLIERYIKTEPPRSVYDALLLPALNYAERDRLEQRLSPEEEAAVIDATRELLSDAAESIRRQQPEPPAPPVDASTSRTARTAARPGLRGQRHRRRARARDARPRAGRSANRRRGHHSAHAGLGTRVARASAAASRSSASPICHRARRRRRATWSRGCAPRCPRCGSWSGAGRRRRWPTRARKRCGMPARRSSPATLAETRTYLAGLVGIRGSRLPSQPACMTCRPRSDVRGTQQRGGGTHSAGRRRPKRPLRNNTTAMSSRT